MKTIIGVRFRKPGKIYFFDPGNLKVDRGSNVIVETSQGQEFGEVMIANREIPEEKLSAPLKKIIRVATNKDMEHEKENKVKEKEAFEICAKKVKEHKLDMNLTEVEYKFDNSKLIFFFTADGRIDFRDLVKDLAAIFHTRIELRQIGARDEVRRLGGNGMCGRELCCCSFLRDFENVSIKMAKEQNYSLNPSKISGNCGRLMCCLKYEQEVYDEKIAKLPKIGAIVKTPDGEGEITGIETLKERVKVKFNDGEETFFKRYEASDVKVIKDVQTPGNDDTNLNKEELEELKKLEKLAQNDKKNEEDDM